MILSVEGINALLRIICIDPSESLKSLIKLIHGGVLVVQPQQIAKPGLHSFMKRIFEREPVYLSCLAPLTLLSEFLTHEEKLLPGVTHHECVSCPEICKFVHSVSRHLTEHGALQMYHLIMREHEDIILGRIVAHCECHLVVVVLSEDWIELHVITEVMHPSHIPLEGESETVVFHIPCHLGPCGGLFRYHHGSGEFPEHTGIQVLEKLDRFKVFITAVLIGYPLAVSLTVIKI